MYNLAVPDPVTSLNQMVIVTIGTVASVCVFLFFIVLCNFLKSGEAESVLHESRDCYFWDGIKRLVD